jgi:uncharacterized protein (DUF1330 family)
MAAYVIAHIDVKDPALFEQYRLQVPEHIRRHGGEYLVRGGATTVVEGTWQPKRLVILRFPDKAAAQAFVDDPAYAPVAALRQRAAHTDLVIVEGV